MKPNFKVLSWQEARGKIAHLNSRITEVIDQLDPPQDLKIYHLTLPYGYEFLQKGMLNFSGLDIPEKYLNNISSMGILLTKQLEFYIDVGPRTLPYAIIKPGDLFGGWGHILTQHMVNHYRPWFRWNLSSGARSLFLLAKISDQESLNRLKRIYPFQAKPPKQSNQQWYLFKELAAYEGDWVSELLLFDQKWFGYIEDLQWAGFYFHGINEIAKRQGFLIDSLGWQIIFSEIHERPAMKYPSYILDTVKHLFAIGVGGMPGFAPVLNNESAPVTFLQRAFQDIYQLEYLPVMMGLDQFSKNNPSPQPIYYALHYPLAMDYSAKLVGSTNLKNLVILDHVLKKHLEIFQAPESSNETPNLHYFSKILKFDLFHAKSDALYTNILSSEELIAQDSRFTEAAAHIRSAEFPHNVSFMNGCIRIRWD